MAASRAPTGPYGRARNRWRPVEPLPDLMVEHLKVRVYLLGGGVSMAALTVEHLKVLMVEPPKG